MSGGLQEQTNFQSSSGTTTKPRNGIIFGYVLAEASDNTIFSVQALNIDIPWGYNTFKRTLFNS